MKKVMSVLITVTTIFLFFGTAAAKETIKIGLIAPLTGDVKTFGESTKNSFNIAV